MQRSARQLRFPPWRFARKDIWGYPGEFPEACREELTYSEAQIDSDDYRFVVCESEGEIIGFYALLLLSPEEAELEALFVVPERIGQGFGRSLINHAKEHATMLAIRRIIIQVDPNAESFCFGAGGIPDGGRESGSIPGRILPIFRIDLQDAREAKTR